MKILAAFAVLLAASPRAFALQASNTPNKATLAIEHVDVVPMDREIVLRDQTVIVRGGEIAELGPASKIAVPEGAQRINGKGKFLMPGLADMHVHTWDESDLTLFAVNGVTTVRNMFGAPLHLGWRARTETGELFGPRILTAGPIIDGDPPIWPGSDILSDAAEAEGIVVAQKEAGYDFLKAYAKLELGPYDALLVAAKKHDMRVMGHVPYAVGIRRVLAGGQLTIEHLDGYAAETQAADSPLAGKVDFKNEHEAWAHVDPEKLRELALATRTAGVWNCPTLVVFQKWISTDEAPEMLARPELRYVAPVYLQYWAPENSAFKSFPRTWFETVRAGIVHRKKAVLALHTAGARILLGTDMGNPFVVPGWSAHEELENLADAGLSNYEALRAGTSGAAECMRASDDWGSIAVGRSADLLLLDADPLQDVKNTRRIAGVMLRGVWHPADELAAKLEALAEKNREH